jgi:hypothetical protein
MLLRDGGLIAGVADTMVVTGMHFRLELGILGGKPVDAPLNLSDGVGRGCRGNIAAVKGDLTKIGDQEYFLPGVTTTSVMSWRNCRGGRVSWRAR